MSRSAEPALTASRRLAFWLAVAGVSVLANFGAEVVGLRFGQPGFQRFLSFTHAHPGTEPGPNTPDTGGS